MITLIIFLVVLSVLVFVHEFGHFWTAKKMGMDVQEFGFGFPPRAWGIKKGGTLYSINWLPLGGFVKIKGEDGTQREDQDSFAAKKPWQRILVLSAGVLMNIFLAMFLLSIGYMLGLPQAVDGSTSPMARDIKVQVLDVLPDSPAAKAGIQSGDVIVSIDGQQTKTSQAFSDLMAAKVGETVQVSVIQKGQLTEKNIPVIKLKETGRGGIGVAFMVTGTVSYPFHLAVYHGVVSTLQLTGQIVAGFFMMIKGLLMGKGAGTDVSGPVGIAVLTGEVAKLGLVYLIQFMAMLSVNLAVINFLPFPALDGGRVLFVIAEKLRGRAINEKVEGITHAIGFALLMLLVIVVTFKDVLKLF